MAGMNQFTQKAKRVLSLAQLEAERLHQSEIDTGHLLLGLVLERGSIAQRVLLELGLEMDALQNLVNMDPIPDEVPENYILADETRGALERALEEARQTNQRQVGTEHILLALSHNEGSRAMQLLAKFGITPQQVRREVRRAVEEARESDEDDTQQAPRPEFEKHTVGKEQSSRQKKSEESKTPLVDQLATDLTAWAEDGRLDPVVGRKKEIERVIQILARRTKNNPALIGDPGVGKTAIVEGLAQRIVDGDVPALLLNKRVLQLDVGSLVAGTMYRGQFEERLKRVIEELKTSGAIVFFDELHMLVGAGGAGGQVDAANILKPALSRGELQVIGATTLNEYRKHIESDAALERRFQPIVVDQPSVDETIEILKGIRPNYEEHHRLNISDEALESAATLSSRYVTERFLPDKAIDLVDEAASRVRMYKSENALNSKELMVQLRELRKEMRSVRKDGDNDRLQELLTEQAGLEEQLQGLQQSWDRAKAPNLSAEDVAEVISMWTGIPLTQLETTETENLLNMEDKLGKVIIGQSEAIEAVSKAVRRARAGLKNPHRPVGSFMFLGPTGVGKTELTKALANLMFGSEEALIQIDMSEFMERHSVSRLVGAPPGYIGYEEAGQLTEAIRRKPYSIVVFDEVEKAHPEALHLLLQIMEEGHLSDAKGHKVDFKNAIVIMTTNIGADLIKRQNAFGFSLDFDAKQEEQQAYDEMHKKLMEALKRSFRPEFINRLDSVIVFRALNRENIRQIVALEIEKVSERLSEYKLHLQPTDAALDALAEEGYDPEMGARPVRRVIQQQVEEQLSDAILAGTFKAGDTILVDAEEQPAESEESKPSYKIVLRKGDSLPEAFEKIDDPQVQPTPEG